eukprot:11198223-Lingulodinium_polyedra.AAC.1
MWISPGARPWRRKTVCHALIDRRFGRTCSRMVRQTAASLSAKTVMAARPQAAQIFGAAKTLRAAKIVFA